VLTAPLTRPRVPQPRGEAVLSTPERTDAELLSAVGDGDRAALEELYRRHAPWLAARLRRRCSDLDLVDEVLQDAFVAAWRGAGRYDGRGEVGAWLWGSAVRRLVDAVRRSPRPTTALVDAREPSELVGSAEEQVLLGLEHGALGPALDRLSPELLAVVRATVLDGLTTREAARLLGIPPGTVKTRMMRARAQLREDLA
jgi:RNA polymerase sigma-70 factor (ECF subfamily)